MTWTINGTDPRTLGLVVETPTGWRSMPGKRRTVATIPYVPGARPLDAAPQEQPRRLQVAGVIRGTSVSDAQSKLDSLIALFSAPTLAVIFNDQPGRQYNAEIEDFTVQVPAAAIIARDLPVQINLVMYDPFAYDTANTTVTPAPGPTACPLGTGPVRPVLTITATGALANPIWTLKNSAGATIQTLNLFVNLVNTDVLIIDCAAKTIKLNGVSRLDILSGGDFFVLDALTQGNYATSAWPTITGPGTATLSVVYKKAWRN